MKTQTYVLLLVGLILAAAVAAAAPMLPKAGPVLERALVDPEAVMQRADGTWTVWAFLTDRNLTVTDLDQALLVAERALPERTRRRRAKVTPAGQQLVDARDLPVSSIYREQVAATGAHVRQTSRWLNAVSVDATREQLARLAQLACVERLELVARFRRPSLPVSPAEAAAAEQAQEDARSRAGTPGRDEIDYGPSLATLEQINVPPVHAMGITGEGIVVGMLDTGFKTTHEALADIPVLARYDFINGDDVVENEPGDHDSQHNHGTQTMSTTMGFASGELVSPAFGVSAILAKTEDYSQEVPIEEDYWVAGLEWVESLGADIVSSSLGYHDWYEFADLDGNTAVTTIAADLAVGRGLVVVNSAGNERGSSFNHIIAPADGDSVISVGAVSLDGDIASFSSPGPSYDGRIKPDISAQGVSNRVVSVTNDQGYTLVSGTSFSCPLSAGVAALVLSRAPGLTPMQVREAMRMTADRADNPDNDFGWGILDAYAAVTYWGATIVHTPLTDTEDTTSPLFVDAEISDRLPLDPTRMDVVWRADGGLWQRTPLVLVAGDLWQAMLPAQPAGSEVSYYLEVTDSAAITTVMPLAGAAMPYAFQVGPDTTPPVLTHTPIGDQPLITWPPLVSAMVTDNLGVDHVAVSVRHNGGPAQTHDLVWQGDDRYTLPLPLAAGDLVIGDQVSYQIVAVDSSAGANETATAWIDFEIIDTLGVVLVIDDGSENVRDLKLGPDKQPLAPLVGRSAATEVAQWLGAAGYVADTIAADAVTPVSFDGYQAVFYSAGDHTSPLTSAVLREALSDHVDAGGRLVVEGGEVGYDALNSPGYPGFAADVLHAASWRADSGGALVVAVAHQFHPVLTSPHLLPTTIAIDYDGYGDEDAIDPAADAIVIMETSSYAGAAGILVHDDNPAPQAGQIVYLAFAITAVDPALGPQIVENAVAYLLADEGPATASISGTITLAGSGDASGAIVSLSGGPTVVTGADGVYTFDALYGGIYTVTVIREGFTAGVEQVTLADGEALTGVDFALVPVVSADYAVAPDLAIPDNNSTGVTSVIQVAETGPLAGVTVDIDITHTFIGDLVVTLISPAGVQIALHNRTGGSSDDLVGNWPETLVVDGPGSLDDLLGTEAGGIWILNVADRVGSDVGTLNAWGLHLLVPDLSTATAELPRTTRLAGNAPNPFNPQTEIAFDLARTGPVRLDVFDPRGRRVRQLVAETLTAGSHAVRWDGRDDGGRETASGVYVCRLVAAETTALHKMLLVR